MTELFLNQPIEPVRELSLESLRAGHTLITPDSAGYFIENCKVCFHNQNHQSHVLLRVQFDKKVTHFRVTWDGNVTQAMLRAWRKEDKKNTEAGAIALTMLIIPELTGYHTMESAGYGTGMDYVLVDEPPDDIFIFNEFSAYLEITGIARQTKWNSVSDRISEKKARINKVREKDINVLGSLPTIIACTEFSVPWMRIVTYD